MLLHSLVRNLLFQPPRICFPAKVLRFYASRQHLSWDRNRLPERRKQSLLSFYYDCSHHHHQSLFMAMEFRCGCKENYAYRTCIRLPQRLECLVIFEQIVTGRISEQPTIEQHDVKTPRWYRQNNSNQSNYYGKKSKTKTTRKDYAWNRLTRYQLGSRLQRPRIPSNECRLRMTP